jgi:hypothetical protein
MLTKPILNRKQQKSTITGVIKAHFYQALTILAHRSDSEVGGNDVKHDHESAMLATAHMRDMLDVLRLTTFDSNPLQFLLRLEQLRSSAARQGMTAVDEIAAAFEAALQHAGKNGSRNIADNFLGILDDAIGVAHVHPKASEALLASLAIRFGG